MNICLLTAEYHTESFRTGGIGRAFGKMAHWFVDHGHQVLVIVSSTKDEELIERPGIRVRRIATRSHMHWRLRPLINRLPREVRELLWNRDTRATLADETAKAAVAGKADVVLTSPGLAEPLASRRVVPLVIRLQNPWREHERAEFRRITLTSLLCACVEKRAAQYATRIYAPSQESARKYHRLRTLPIPVIRTPMFPLEQPGDWRAVALKYDLPDQFLLFTAGLLGSKGAHVLADALPEFFAQRPDTHALLVGRTSKGPKGGAMDAYVRERCRDFPLRLHILPPVKHAELFAMLQQARFVVQPTLVDNLPNALLEAMYFGRLIVASRGASLDEILDDSDSLLVPPGDARALVEAMLLADQLSDKQRAELGAKAAKKVLRVCDPDTVMNQVVALCEEAIRDHGKCQRLETGGFRFFQ